MTKMEHPRAWSIKSGCELCNVLRSFRGLGLVYKLAIPNVWPDQIEDENAHHLPTSKNWT
jgi:hypothetical protein